MITKSVARRDDQEDSRLRVMLDDQGDAYVAVYENGLYHGARFCTLQGGGRSPKTLRALRALAEAIEEDNRTCPARALPQ